MSISHSPQAALPLFEAIEGDWLAAARRVALQLGEGGREVTIDDVRAKCPPPDHLDPRIMGSVLARRHWLCVRYQQSTRGTCHKRPIGVFVLRNGSGGRA